MRIRNVKNAKEILKKSNYVVENYEEYKGCWNKLFDNDKSIHLEIGMGKGDFLIGKALENPDINFIGVEKYESIISRAVKKLEDKNLNNLKIIRVDALELNKVFDHEIDLIYLNFSDPWPKVRHAKRRLTNEIFLKVYDNLFRGKKIIVQKTDNVCLFESSIVSFSEYGYVIKEICLDLGNSKIPNIETEYEKKFKSRGMKINYVRVEKDNN